MSDDDVKAGRDALGLHGFHRGVRSVYLQAVHEDRLEIADWIKARYPVAVEP